MKTLEKFLEILSEVTYEMDNTASSSVSDSWAKMNGVGFIGQVHSNSRVQAARNEKLINMTHRDLDRLLWVVKCETWLFKDLADCLSDICPDFKFSISEKLRDTYVDPTRLEVTDLFKSERNLIQAWVELELEIRTAEKPDDYYNVIERVEIVENSVEFLERKL